MQAFTVHTGIGVPLRRSDVDTDQIIPARFLRRVARNGFEDALFSAWREDPDFVLNQTAYAHGSVLVAGKDFGTGSSREHAVWALQNYGFRAVLAPRFADIFRGNAGKQGLLAAQLETADIETLWRLLEATPGAGITVDLTERTVTCGEFVAGFTVDDHTRHRLLNGLDDIAQTLLHVQEIDVFERERPARLPTTVPADQSAR